MVRTFIRQSVALPILLLFAMTLLLLGPAGAFAINDDWIHARVVATLLASGRYTGHPYLAATFVAQAYWGAAFAALFGFSFTVLRCSTIVAAFIGAWALARCAVACSVPRPWAVLCAVCFAFNPLVLALSYTFMTDVPFAAMVNIGGLLFVLALTRRSPALAALGSTAAIGAFFIRQFGLLLPVAFLATLVLAWWCGRDRRVWPMAAATIAPWIGAALLFVWLESATEDATPILQPLSGRVFVAIMDGLRHWPVALIYIGLFAAPLGLAAGWRLLRGGASWGRRQSIIAVVWTGAAIAAIALPKLLLLMKRLTGGDEPVWLARYRVRMPLLQKDYLLDLAVGNLQFVRGTTVVQIGAWWWLPTILGLIISALLVVAAFDALAPLLRRRSGAAATAPDSAALQRAFLVLWAGIFIAAAYNPWRVFVFDRYLLPALAPALVLLAALFLPRAGRSGFTITVVATAAVYGFALAATQDYLAWNRAAWEASDALVARGVSPQQIRSIDAWNGWHTSEAYMAAHGTRNWRDADIGRSGPWVFDDQYMITRSEPLPGYVVVDRIAYDSWLPGADTEIVVAVREDGP